MSIFLKLLKFNMSTPIHEITEQNTMYRKGLIIDIKKQNSKLERLMDETKVFQESEKRKQRLNSMNSLTLEQRRELMSGQSLESILNIKSSESKYYNTSDEAAASISSKELFEYHIGKHFLAYEIKDVSIDEELQLIKIPVVVRCENNGDYDWDEFIYTIVDENVFKTLNPPKSISTNVDNSVQLDKTIREIQDKLFNKLFDIFQGENEYSQTIYTSSMESKIEEHLNNGRFPFQILNDIIAEYIQ